MKKFISVIAVMVGFVYLTMAQSTETQVGNSDNYKAQNNRLSPGVDEPVFDGAKLESNEAMANANYKNQFSKNKNKGNGNIDLLLLPEKEKSNNTGFYAAGYSKSGFQATRRKPSPKPESVPLVLTTPPTTSQE